MIRNIDRNIARFEDWLAERELKDNTLVVFVTDNGGTGGVEFFNAGMRGRTESNYEGGHRAACFIRWPNGSFVNPYPVSCATQIQDLLPTFLDILDLEGRPDYELDGRSLRPVLMEGRPLDDRMFVVQFGPDARPEEDFSCVVWDSWRLVGDDELYDLSTDPGQQKNVAGEYPEILDKMKAFHRKYWSEVEAGIDQFVPVIVGSEREDPKLITSSVWEEGAVNGQRGIARALGPPRGGVTHIDVVQEGSYLVELSRWPFHLKRGLTMKGPESTVGGTRIETGRALSIEFGCLSIDEEEPLISRKIDGEVAIRLEVNLPAGRHRMRA